MTRKKNGRPTAGQQNASTTTITSRSQLLNSWHELVRDDALRLLWNCHENNPTQNVTEICGIVREVWSKPVNEAVEEALKQFLMKRGGDR